MVNIMIQNPLTQLVTPKEIRFEKDLDDEYSKIVVLLTPVFELFRTEEDNRYTATLHHIHVRVLYFPKRLADVLSKKKTPETFDVDFYHSGELSELISFLDKFTPDNLANYTWVMDKLDQTWTKPTGGAYQKATFA